MIDEISTLAHKIMTGELRHEVFSISWLMFYFVIFVLDKKSGRPISTWAYVAIIRGI